MIDTSPRFRGILEQYERAQLFLKEALDSADRRDRFRRLVAAIYPARAVVELMLTAAKLQFVKISREELETQLVPLLPRYYVIERLRIHDFHRYCLTFEPGAQTMIGPVKLTASKGEAALSIGADGPETTVTGNSKVESQRPLYLRGDDVLDEEAKSYVPLYRIVAEYLTGIPAAIELFDSLLQASMKLPAPTPAPEPAEPPPQT